MSSFTDKLTVTQVGPQLWETDRQFVFFIGDENSKDFVLVPKGFQTDFASVPWPASMLIPMSGQYNQAAVLHDYLYWTQTRSRAEADKIFLEAMEVLGVNPFKRQLMYCAVRLGGWMPWIHHAKELKKREISQNLPQTPK